LPHRYKDIDIYS